MAENQHRRLRAGGAVVGEGAPSLLPTISQGSAESCPSGTHGGAK